MSSSQAAAVSNDPETSPLASISEAEARFERIRRTVGLIFGPIAFAIVALMPIAGLSVEAHRLAAVVALVVVWWVTEAIPIAATALVGAALTVLYGVATPTEAFAPFANPTIFLFMGSFMIGQAVVEHRLDTRLAVGLLKLPAVAGNVNRTVVALGAMTLLLSGWMSNTATTAMMAPIALGVLGAASQAATRKDVSFRAGFLLTVAYAASIGGMLTPVGSPPNLITLGLLEKIAGVQISFFQWMMLVAPIALAYGGLMLVLAQRVCPAPPHARLRAVDNRQAPAATWTRGQRNCAIAFGVAVVLWVLPGIAAIAGVSGATGELLGRLDEGVVAILAAMLLFVLPIDWKRRQFTMEWQTASRIDWGTILLFGGGLSLGQLMFTTGLAAAIGTAAVNASGAESLWAITAVATAVAVILSEFTSNTAATSMLVPVVLSITSAAGLNPIPPALGTCLGASLSFMLPISTPPNAIVYGTGMVPITTMMRYGIVMDVLGFLLIMAGLRILCPLLGFA
jgi:sodium-dependent dicarboxylate transporter 2/3/5